MINSMNFLTHVLQFNIFIINNCYIQFVIRYNIDTFNN